MRRKEHPKSTRRRSVEEWKELEEQQTKETMILAQRKHKLRRLEGKKRKDENAAEAGRIKSNKTRI